MSKRWRVNEGTQIFIGDKRYVGGETFTASDGELDEFGSRAYVSEVAEKKAEAKAQAAPVSTPKAENKAQAAPKPSGQPESK